MPGVPTYIYAYNYVPYTYGTAVPAPSVCRSTTRNTPWTRPAARHGTRLPRHGRPPRERSIHISRCSSVVRGTPLLFLHSRGNIILFYFFFFRLSSMSSLSSRFFSFRIFHVIGSKVNRSKVIFSSQSLPLVPRGRSVSGFFFFFILDALLFFALYLLSFSFCLSLLFHGAALQIRG